MKTDNIVVGTFPIRPMWNAALTRFFYPLNIPRRGFSTLYILPRKREIRLRFKSVCK